MSTCGWCGVIHGPRCPLVKAMEYHQDGTLKRVEFFAPNDYPTHQQLWTLPQQPFMLTVTGP